MVSRDVTPDLAKRSQKGRRSQESPRRAAGSQKLLGFCFFVIIGAGGEGQGCACGRSKGACNAAWMRARQDPLVTFE